MRAIAYRFPDGHTEQAIVGETGLWSMEYLPSDGPLADWNVDQTTLDPITVHVRYTDGGSDDIALRWGLDTCAQTNHGC